MNVGSGALQSIRRPGAGKRWLHVRIGASMRVGTIKEMKNEEFRVGLTPSGVQALFAAGHEVLVECGAGIGSGFADAAYEAAGAKVCDSAADVVAGVDLKESLPAEYGLLRPVLLRLTYLHLAPEPELTRRLLESRTNAIAYETVQRPDGSLPLLIPMSQVAGRMAGEIAAQYLKKPGPGRGKLLGGIAGVSPAPRGCARRLPRAGRRARQRSSTCPSRAPARR